MKTKRESAHLTHEVWDYAVEDGAFVTNRLAILTVLSRTQLPVVLGSPCNGVNEKDTDGECESATEVSARARDAPWHNVIEELHLYSTRWRVANGDIEEDDRTRAS